MYNVLQPVVDLTNANIETLSRFANSRKVTELAKDSIDNYVRFANDYTKNLYGIVSQGQEFVSRQVEEGNKRVAQVADISGRTVHAGTESVKSAGKETLKETDQASRPDRGK